MAGSKALALMSRAEISELLANGKAEQIASVVAAASDENLRSLMGDADLRTAAVGAALDKFADFTVAEQVSEVHGVVRFVLAYERGDDERYDVTFDGSGVSASPSMADDPDLVISASALDFLRLVSGSASAALLLLSGRLRAEGDEALALQVGGVFRVPGSDGVAVDPGALDAEVVAGVIAKAKDSHLRHVMKGGFRDVILTEIFRRFPEYVDARRAKNLVTTIGFKIGGPGEPDRYVVSIDHGACDVEKDGQAPRKATIALGGAEFLKLATGNLNPTTAFLRRALTVKGDLSAALSLSAVMKIPSGAK